MKRIGWIAALLLVAPALFAQDWRDRPYTRRGGDNSFELTPFTGYRWGGTIYSDVTNLYGHDVDLQSSGHYGVNFGIPIAPNGMKLELMVNRQDTTVGNNGGIFTPGTNEGDFHVTYYHAGLLIPIGYTRDVVPFAVVSAGIANLDPAMSNVSSANKFSASAGIGVKVPITPNLSIRGEIRGYYTALGSDNGCSACYYYNYNHDLTQGEANVGLAIRF